MERQRKRMNMLPTLCALMLCWLAGNLPAQVTHSYPRVGIFHFGTPAPPEWYAKFDLVIIRTTRDQTVRDIKVLNPNAHVFGTKDWNRGAGLDPVPEEWRTHNSRGQDINLYNASNFYTVNMSDFCGKAPQYDNKRFTEYLPDYVLSTFDQTAFSGICTDGLWVKPRAANGDIDLNRNGNNDYDEFGKEWVETQWRDGVDKMIAGLRNRMDPNRILIINSGRFHDFYWQESNGLILENHSYTGNNFSWYRRIYQRWMDEARKPHVLLYDGKGRDKSEFAFMRYLLGLTLFGDGYFSFSENDLHHYHGYYDEYDIDLGFPKGEMTQIRSTGSDDHGIWVRFFTKGAVIVNVDDQSATVSDADLQPVSGYAGPYYRFQGGQDPDVNNGQRFNQISLSADRNSKGFRGDAILLTREPTVVVSDIIIDNDDEGTSPGTAKPPYKGSWTQTNDNIDKVWTLSARQHKDAWAIAFAQKGNGESTATFTPTIGLAGKYKIYEWHGDIQGVAEASDVPYEIRHAGGTQSGRINQATRYGRWNLIGEFRLNKGKNAYIRISNNANGAVVADAFRFVYSEGVTGDATPPNPPTGVMIRP
ncbi:MAG: putative glycoside hydrolase [Calditrichaeota bacterium]|nr:putative glycoside hydrolase [Calditrichota bacterium]